MILTGEKVKVTPCTYREGIWCSDGIAPLILNLDISKWSASRPGHITLGEEDIMVRMLAYFCLLIE